MYIIYIHIYKIHIQYNTFLLDVTHYVNCHVKHICKHWARINNSIQQYNSIKDFDNGWYDCLSLYRTVTDGDFNIEISK